ncbi:hypothetical protein TIFTF001_015652 [Ficus carica]|uniref:non-specific serine/threonine protein kinase n=1 Tax=Ficus carica TaxID=3494 RepID=A0AA88A690_FICCA|nr:hypothetical protein TIFTF001_015652 [Ficus carica]
MPKPSISIIGGAAGAIAFVAALVGLVWLCRFHCKKLSNKNSETGSSDPSALVEWNRGGGARSSGAALPSFGLVGARQFRMEELEQVTNQFSESNLIGYGSFGSVYKGFLRDGTIVAVKKRAGAPKQEFAGEVASLSEIHHRNLVTLLGYCQESGSQMLVFEYLPSGSVCNHLYDTRKDPSTKLEFKQRVSIALGAATGLCHLHGLKPPLVHKNFKTANVLVDENFIAKVADAGVSKLLEKIEEAGPSRESSVNVFQDPEVGTSRAASAMSDVYSFGVFLLELVTGQEALRNEILGSNESLVQWLHDGGNEGFDPADTAMHEFPGQKASEDGNSRARARTDSRERNGANNSHGRRHCHNYIRKPTI